jgi:PAS domain S-box-containing protein
MVAPVDGLFGVSLLAGVCLCWIGGHAVREFDALGVRSFAAFAVVLGLGGILTGVVGIAGWGFPGEVTTPLWVQVSIVFWALSMVPWFTFALQYTGRYIRIRPRLVALLLAPFLGIGFNVVASIREGPSVAISAAIGSLVFVFYLALGLVGAYLVVRSTGAYGHLSRAQGSGLAAAPVVLFLGANTSSVFAASDNPLAAAGVYGAALGIGALALGVVLVRHTPFETTPAVGTIGERAIVRETDDLVFVVDDRDRVVKLNETAVEQLGVDRAEALDARLPDLLDHEATDLADLETVTIQTEAGTRRYDPEVSTITAPPERELGAMLSLRDVTERELREQRLAVLNRVLRHNLRNKVEVVRSRAETLADGHASEDTADDHAETIVETADEIADLGRSARTIDQFVSESAGETPVDLGGAIEDTLEAIDRDRAALSVTVETPEAAQVVTNRRALAAALQSAIDNALTYADATVEIAVEPHEEGYVISIADDGPGIPDGELQSLERGTETPLQHGTGLGLWQLKWAVTTLNGELSFDTTDGTTVEIVVPDRRS